MERSSPSMSVVVWASLAPSVPGKFSVIAWSPAAFIALVKPWQRKTSAGLVTNWSTQRPTLTPSAASSLPAALPREALVLADKADGPVLLPGRDASQSCFLQSASPLPKPSSR